MNTTTPTTTATAISLHDPIHGNTTTVIITRDCSINKYSAQKTITYDGYDYDDITIHTEIISPTKLYDLLPAILIDAINHPEPYHKEFLWALQGYTNASKQRGYVKQLKRIEEYLQLIRLATDTANAYKKGSLSLAQLQYYNKVEQQRAEREAENVLKSLQKQAA